MRLRSTDITKVKRLSLREVKLPAPEVRVEPNTTESSPTDEDIIYSKLLAKNSLLEELVNKLGLVSKKTGNKLNRVNIVT